MFNREYKNYNKVNYTQKDLSLARDNVFSMDKNYPETFSRDSVLDDNPLKYEKTVYYLNVNSNDRDTTNYPLQYDFKLELNKVYKNVTAVELISVIFPNITGITSEPYLVLDINELNTVDFTNKNNTHQGFGVCPLKNPNQTSNGFVLTEISCAFHTQSVFKKPKQLSRLSIKIRDMYGEIYRFGFSEGVGSVLKADQISFVIKITTQDIDMSVLTPKNVY